MDQSAQIFSGVQIVRSNNPCLSKQRFDSDDEEDKSDFVNHAEYIQKKKGEDATKKMQDAAKEEERRAVDERLALEKEKRQKQQEERQLKIQRKIGKRNGFNETNESTCQRQIKDKSVTITSTNFISHNKMKQHIEEDKNKEEEEKRKTKKENLRKIREEVWRKEKQE